MKKSSLVCALICSILLAGCAISTEYSAKYPDRPLNRFSRVYIVPNFTEVWNDVHMVKVPEIFNEISHPQADTVISAHKNIAFVYTRKPVMEIEKLKVSLSRIGYRIVSRPEDADAIIDFRFRGVRYNQLDGWKADQAALRFLDPELRTEVAAFFVESHLFPVSVYTMITRITRHVEKHYEHGE